MALICVACLEFGHYKEECPYDNPCFVMACARDEVESPDEWFCLKAQDQLSAVKLEMGPSASQAEWDGGLDALLTYLKYQCWCLACGEFGHLVLFCPLQHQEEELPTHVWEGTTGQKEEEGEGRAFPEANKGRSPAVPRAKGGGAFVVPRDGRGGASAVSNAKGDVSAVIFRAGKGGASTGSRVSRATAGPTSAAVTPTCK
ncbi:UNVERIFIED_CONTAM: hypothetical protein FKN15_040304 [Acipenser sinensis]